MAETVGSHAVAALTSPVNGDPLSATVVLSNDNTVRAAYVTHDADPGIHLQSSTLASRPAFGVAGRKWVTSDGLRVYYDTGAAWAEVAYLSLAGGGVVAGSTTFSLDLTVPSITLSPSFATIAPDTGGTLVDTPAGYAVNDVQVVGAQGAAVADATGAGDVVAQLNALLARLRVHGLIAT